MLVKQAINAGGKKLKYKGNLRTALKISVLQFSLSTDI